jgi:hypothetical protein
MLKRYVKSVGSLAARWMLSLSLLDNAVEGRDLRSLIAVICRSNSGIFVVSPIKWEGVDVQICRRQVFVVQTT